LRNINKQQQQKQENQKKKKESETLPIIITSTKIPCSKKYLLQNPNKQIKMPLTKLAAPKCHFTNLNSTTP